MGRVTCGKLYRKHEAFVNLLKIHYGTNLSYTVLLEIIEVTHFTLNIQKKIKQAF